MEEEVLTKAEGQGEGATPKSPKTLRPEVAAIPPRLRAALKRAKLHWEWGGSCGVAPIVSTYYLKSAKGVEYGYISVSTYWNGHKTCLSSATFGLSGVADEVKSWLGRDYKYAEFIRDFNEICEQLGIPKFVDDY